MWSCCSGRIRSERHREETKEHFKLKLDVISVRLLLETSCDLCRRWRPGLNVELVLVSEAGLSE